MEKIITVNLSYYNQPKNILMEHINNWKSFPKEIKDLFRFFIIDDASKISIEELLKTENLEDIDIHLYRVKQDLYCNIAGVRNLGAMLDSRMDMEQHVNSVSRSCYGQLRQIGHIRQYLTSDATKSLVNSLVTSRLDYCNVLLNGMPNTVMKKMQNVQNTAARIVTRTSRYSHITPVLKELHWLPVQYRVQYKTLTTTYKALHGQSPEYIQNMLKVYSPQRNLRSKHNATTLVVPSCRTAMYGDRSFVAIAPKLWNSLPAGIRDCDTFASFKRALKTHFFIEKYGN